MGRRGIRRGNRRGRDAGKTGRAKLICQYYWFNESKIGCGYNPNKITKSERKHQKSQKPQLVKKMQYLHKKVTFKTAIQIKSVTNNLTAQII